MKIILVDTAYAGLLKKLGLLENPSKKGIGYQEAAKKLDAEAFGSFPLYERSLRDLGHDVQLITPNNRLAQLIWARANGVKVWFSHAVFFSHWEWISRFPFFGHWFQHWSPVGRILKAQLISAQAQLVLVGDLSLLSASQIRGIREATGCIIFGQIAAPLPSRSHLSSYDLIFSAHPGIVMALTKQGLDAKFLPLAFGEPADIVAPTPYDRRRNTAAFIGSFGRHHRINYTLLEALKHVCPDIEIYGNPSMRKLKGLGLEGNYKGKVFGKEMLEIFGQVKVGVNRHAKFANSFAVNMRMYEVTGRGAALLTESFENLHDLFPEGSVVGYEDSIDAAKLLDQLLNEGLPARDIASKGQIHTLEKHTYVSRSIEILNEYQDRRGLLN